jgi:N-acetylmuramoyl-L-alanine amidase
MAFERLQGDFVLDPGHGGEDFGARIGSFYEKEIVWDIASRLAVRFQRSPFTFQSTRIRDVGLTVDQRSGIANHFRPGAFLSIHVGAAPTSSVSGPTVYVHQYLGPPPERSSIENSEPAESEEETQEEPFSEPSEPLRFWQEAQREHLAQSRVFARLLQSRLNAVWGTENRVVEAPLEILCSVAAPAVLLEMGRLTNTSDREQLSFPEFRSQIAAAIYLAVTDFLNSQNPAR